MPDPTHPAPRERRFPWRTVFHRTAAAVFVVGPTRRLRYANPAWEVVTGRLLANARGMRISSRASAGALAQTLAPPPEVWAGRPATVRRPAPDADAGPPWWDVAFTPLPDAGGRPLAVVGVLSVVGTDAAGPPRRSAPAALAALRRRVAADFPFDLFTTAAPAASHLPAQVRLAAQTHVPVWVVGEPGTGKETLARVVHHNGPARERAFVGVDCGWLQPYIVEGVLFGKGGLVGSGHLGTLYLRDPAALPRDLQDRVARLAVPPRPGGFRLVCGSTKPAADDVIAGRLIPPFQSDLSVLELRLPPLRDRLDDLPRFVDRLLDRFPSSAGAKLAVADDVVPVLRAHSWPGNLRELADVLQQAAGEAGAGPLTRVHLPRYVRERHLIASDPPPPAGKAWTLDGVLESVERRLIELALHKAGGSQTDAAAALGVVRARLGRRIEALGMGGPRTPDPGTR